MDTINPIKVAEKVVEGVEKIGGIITSGGNRQFYGSICPPNKQVAIIINGKYVNIDSNGYNNPSPYQGHVFKSDVDGNLTIVSGIGKPNMAWKGYRLNYNKSGVLMCGSTGHPTWQWAKEQCIFGCQSENWGGGGNRYFISDSHCVYGGDIQLASRKAVLFDIETGNNVD